SLASGRRRRTHAVASSAWRNSLSCGSSALAAPMAAMVRSKRSSTGRAGGSGERGLGAGLKQGAEGVGRGGRGGEVTLTQVAAGAGRGATHLTSAHRSTWD